MDFMQFCLLKICRNWCSSNKQIITQNSCLTRAEDQKGQSAQPDDPDGAEREISTITDSADAADAAPLVRSCSEDARVKMSTHGMGGWIRG
jgi:hypothetical protein